MVIERFAALSPRTKARITGFLYLLIFIFAPSDALTATLLNLTITLTCDIAVALLLFNLLKSVNPRLAAIAALFRLLFVVVMASNALHYFGLLPLPSVPSTPAAFNLGYGIALIPFGVHCALIGYLIVRSQFLPKAIGILMLLAGSAYLLFLWPPLGQALFIPYIAVPAVLGEGSLTLWLLIIGIRPQRSRVR
jgi:hypothetical protein